MKSIHNTLSNILYIKVTLNLLFYGCVVGICNLFLNDFKLYLILFYSRPETLRYDQDFVIFLYQGPVNLNRKYALFFVCLHEQRLLQVMFVFVIFT